LDHHIDTHPVAETQPVLSLPATWYHRRETYLAERQAIFARTWQFVGPVSDLARPGDYRAIEIAGFRVFVLRDRAGGLKAFHNICPHRAAPLFAEGAGHCNVLRCRYHGWTFDHDGHLKATPHFGEAAWFDKADYGLKPVRVDVWRGLVFINMNGGAASLAAFMQEITELTVPYPIESFAKVEEVRFEMASNWKTYTDNFVEGYHIPGIHAGLNAAIEFERFETTHKKHVVIMTAPQKGGSIYGGLWLWIWPNMTLSVYPDGMNTSRIIPTSEGRTELIYNFYFADQSPALADKRRATIETNCAIVREDFGICEEAQANLASGIHVAGPLSPRHEDGVRYFHDEIRAAFAEMDKRGEAVHETV
jgi:choline monooxygenase